MTVAGFVRRVDQKTDPFLDSGAEFILNMTLRLLSRLRSAITMDTSCFLDPRTHTEEFDVRSSAP